ncbi:hypothetical protein Y958_24140 [Nitrospirillum viridazoti CBAmc]|uniref:Uncharacterized protein n=1 Tax=Nitrospirillum viridazoti CBAmc TaxID=1441467 RepID=A0A248JZX4_9PROT|nr:hypothetical protein Y958_24140 [Nitrospirillum amazonense CBAmc]
MDQTGLPVQQGRIQRSQQAIGIVFVVYILLSLLGHGNKAVASLNPAESFFLVISAGHFFSWRAIVGSECSSHKTVDQRVGKRCDCRLGDAEAFKLVAELFSVGVFFPSLLSTSDVGPDQTDWWITQLIADFVPQLL